MVGSGVRVGGAKGTWQNRPKGDTRSRRESLTYCILASGVRLSLVKVKRRNVKSTRQTLERGFNKAG